MMNANITISTTGVTALSSRRLTISKLYPISGRQEEKNIMSFKLCWPQIANI